MKRDEADAIVQKAGALLRSKNVRTVARVAPRSVGEGWVVGPG